MPLGTEVGLGPSHMVVDRDPAPPTVRDTEAIVAKRSPISATAELLSCMIQVSGTDKNSEHETLKWRQRSGAPRTSFRGL